MARRVIIRSLRDPNGGGTGGGGVVTEQEVEIGGTEPPAPAELWVDTSAVSPPPTGTVTLALDDLTDVATAGAFTGDTILFDAATGQWTPGAGGGGTTGPLALGELTDVVDDASTAAVASQVLLWDEAAGQWKPGTQMVGSIPLFANDAARDAALPAPQPEGQLAYVQDRNYYTFSNGTVWEDIYTFEGGGVFGYNAYINSGIAMALGRDSRATLGASSPSDPGTTAVGLLANADGFRATALGGKSYAQGADTTAVGAAASARFANSTALGKSATTTATDQVMLGTATQQVVAPGTLKVSGVNVVTTGATEGQVLTFTGGQWVAGAGGTGGGGPLAINDLTDVDTVTVAPTAGQALVFDGTQWEPGTVTSVGGAYGTFTTPAARDAAWPNPAEGHLAFLQSTDFATMRFAGQWQNVFRFTQGTAYGWLASATATNLANATAVGQEAAANSGVAVGYLAKSAAEGVALGNSSTANGTDSAALGRSASATAAKAVAIGSGAVASVANQIVLGTATEKVVAPGTLKVSGVDVVTTGATEGQVLTFTGGQWVAGTAAGGGGGGALNDLTDVDTVTDPPLTGQLLTFNETTGQWAPGPGVNSAAGGIPIFADAAERDSVITAPVPGMLCFLTYDGRYYQYQSAQWMKVFMFTSSTSVGSNASSTGSGSLAVGSNTRASHTNSAVVATGTPSSIIQTAADNDFILGNDLNNVKIAGTLAVAGVPVATATELDLARAEVSELRTLVTALRALVQRCCPEA